MTHRSAVASLEMGRVSACPRRGYLAASALRGEGRHEAVTNILPALPGPATNVLVVGVRTRVEVSFGERRKLHT